LHQWQQPTYMPRVRIDNSIGADVNVSSSTLA
jgi:hypothetical protein